MRTRWILYGVTAAVTAGVVLYIVLPRSLRLGIVSAGTVAHAAGQDCGCPPMPIIATSKDPARGNVPYELRHTDIEALFSNRHIMFAGGWDDAFVALAHEIDPRGKYKMWDRPAPPIARQVPLVEGGRFIQELLHPPPAQTPGGRRVSPPREGANPWSVTNATAAITHALVSTLARINKYGEPATGLRTATLAAARFVVDTFARIPLEVQQQDQNALRLTAIGNDARHTLTALLSAVRPDAVTRRAAAAAARPAPAARANELQLDDFDLANAALDIFSSVDESGRRSGLFALRHDSDEEQIFNALVEIATARSVFGGSAPPGSPHDAVACRAFSTLVDLADVHTREAATLRDRLLDIYALEAPLVGNPNGRPARLAVVRTALIMTGVESADEAQSLVKHVFDIGMGGVGVGKDATAVEIVTTLRGLMRSAGGADRDTHRKEIADAVNARFENIQKRKDSSFVVPAPEELRLLKAWNAGGGDVQMVGLGGPCRPTPGETKGRIFLYAICVDGLQVIKHPYVGVPMIIEAQFDPPSGEAEVTLDVAFGETTKMTLKRYEPKGYIYRSDPFVPQGASLRQEEVFNPAPPPKREDP